MLLGVDSNIILKLMLSNSIDNCDIIHDLCHSTIDTDKLLAELSCIVFNLLKIEKCFDFPLPSLY